MGDEVSDFLHHLTWFDFGAIGLAVTAWMAATSPRGRA